MHTRINIFVISFLRNAKISLAKIRAYTVYLALNMYACTHNYPPQMVNPVAFTTSYPVPHYIYNIATGIIYSVAVL